jgi:D-serine deaminase-like pyridoxal phosphate-dependent protein
MSRTVASASTTGSGRVVLDSGLKAQSTDSGCPVLAASADEYPRLAAAALAAGSSTLSWDAAAQSFRSSVGGLVVKSVSDEHSTVVPATATGAAADALLPPLGAKLMLMPGHCDPFMNHYDWLVPFEADEASAGDGLVRVFAPWRVSARSPGQ